MELREFRFNQIDAAALIRAIRESERRRTAKKNSWFHCHVVEPLGDFGRWVWTILKK